MGESELHSNKEGQRWASSTVATAGLRWEALEKGNGRVRHHLKRWAAAWISVNGLCELSAGSEYMLRRQWRPRYRRNKDVRYSSSIRLNVLDLYNIVSYCPEKLNIYFHFPLVSVFTNSNKISFTLHW